MYSDISKDIKESFKNIKLKEYNIFNSNLKNLELNRISLSIVDIGYIDYIKNSMINEIVQSISKKSSKVLSDKSKIEFLDLSGYENDFELTRDASNELINYILNSGYKYCIMNSRIAGNIQNDIRFNFSSISSNFTTMSSGDTYFIGLIGDVNLYVDPYIKYDDYKILLFNKFDINLEFLNTSIENIEISTPRLEINYNLGFDIDDSLTCYVIDTKLSNSYNKYISVLRNTKIDKLLND